MSNDKASSSSSLSSSGAFDPSPLADASNALVSDSDQQNNKVIVITKSDEDDDGSSIHRTMSQMEKEEESFYSAEDNKHGDDNIWGLLTGVGGNLYEWYDFALFGLFAGEIGAAFFPTSSKELQLINSFGVFLAAFVMRPIGAVLFGELGDRIAGRKNALIVSIVLITIPSVLMGMLPAYDTWGPVAPVLLMVLRMMQGLSVGGQLAGSYMLSIEQSSSKNRGFRGSVCDASSVSGFLLASGVTTTVRKFFSQSTVDAWAWRIPFWLSLLIAPLLYFLVRNSEESKYWKESNTNHDTEKVLRETEEATNTALWDLLSSPFRRRQLLGAVGVLGAKVSCFYLLFLWTPVYLSNLRGLVSEADASAINFIVLGTYVILLLIGGKLSDFFPHRMDLMRIGIPGIFVGTPAMFGIFESEAWYGFLVGQLQLAFCQSLLQGGAAAWEVELWMADPTLSYTGVAMGHNLAACIFGGTMPLVATFLYYKSEDMAGDDEDALLPRLLPGFYVSALAIVSFFCLSFVVRHPHDLRTGEKKLRDAAKQADEKRKKKSKKKQKKKEEQRRRDEMMVSGYWTETNNTAEHEKYIPPTT